MRSVIGASVLLAVAVAFGSVGACSTNAMKPGSSNEAVGTVGLQLQAAPGVVLNAVTYTITGNGLNLTGTIDVTNSNAISAVIGGIPAGSGYTVTLTATSTDGATTCTGSATGVTVTARTTTAVTVHLQCTGRRRNGSVLVNGVLNVCPTVDAISASPANATTGNTIAIAASASDVDNAPAALTATWSQTSSNGGAGTFGTATSASTTFRCTAPGTVVLTYTTTDSDCSDADSATVTCTGAAIDAGTGGTDSGTGGTDAGGGTDSSTGGGDPNAAILNTKSAACLACANTNCAAELTACGAITGNSSTGTSRASLCTSTLACAVPAGCAASSVSTCYCGTASGAGCLTPGAANGACKSALELGLESTDPATIATAFGDDTLGGGRAMLLMACLSDNACASCF